jgi:hypothetical protein
LRVHELRYAGIDVATKLANLRKELSSVGATAMVVTMLDEVAWLLNMVRISIREVDLNQLKRKTVCRCLHNRFLHTDDMRMNSEATMCLTHQWHMRMWWWSLRLQPSLLMIPKLHPRS